MTAGALERTLARLDEARPAAPAMTRDMMDAPPEMPDFVRRYGFGRWRLAAPRVRMRPIHLPEPHAVLLKSARTRLLERKRTGLEMTCALRGAFRHEGGRSGPGDFDLGDLSVRHDPLVEGASIASASSPCRANCAASGAASAQTFVRL